MTVAALYVDVERGPYATMPDVDAWGVERDASRYDGPHPVVAHPPCGPWGRLAPLCGPRLMAQRPLALRAVEQVRALGGVLEHPNGSRLWREAGLPAPGALPDAWGGWTLEVEQTRWGHPCRKLTWFYIVGTFDIPPLPTARRPTHVVTSSLRKGDPRRLPSVPADETHITPPALAAWLVELASKCARRGASA